MAIKGQPITISITAITASTGLEKTGDSANISVRLIKDGTSGARHDATAITEVDATNASGEYSVVLDATDTNANAITVKGKSATSGVTIMPVKIITEQGRLDAAITTRSSHSVADVKTAIEASGSTLASILANIILIMGAGFTSQSLVTIKAFIDTLALDSTVMKAANYTAPDNTKIGQIKTKTDLIPASPATQGSLDAIALLIDAIMGGTFTDQTLVAIKAAVDGKLDEADYVAPDNTAIGVIQGQTDKMQFDVDNNILALADVSISAQNITDIASGVVTAINGGGDTPYSNTIEYPAGNALPGVEVHCCSDSLGQSIIASTITDDLGAFTFYLVAGTYYIAIQHPQFQGSLTAIVVS